MIQHAIGIASKSGIGWTPLMRSPAFQAVDFNGSTYYLDREWPLLIEQDTFNPGGFYPIGLTLDQWHYINFKVKNCEFGIGGYALGFSRHEVQYKDFLPPIGEERRLDRYVGVIFARQNINNSSELTYFHVGHPSNALSFTYESEPNVQAVFEPTWPWKEYAIIPYNLNDHFAFTFPAAAVVFAHGLVYPFVAFQSSFFNPADAAYVTFQSFYNAPNAPLPTFTVGVVDFFGFGTIPLCAYEVPAGGLPSIPFYGYIKSTQDYTYLN